MKNELLEVVYIFNNAKGISELRILADSIEQRNEWILALCNGDVVGGVKEEYLRAFYMEVHR